VMWRRLSVSGFIGRRGSMENGKGQMEKVRAPEIRTADERRETWNTAARGVDICVRQNDDPAAQRFYFALTR
jgi:hypothetical protein